MGAREGSGEEGRGQLAHRPGGQAEEGREMKGLPISQRSTGGGVVGGGKLSMNSFRLKLLKSRWSTCCVKCPLFGKVTELYTQADSFSCSSPLGASEDTDCSSLSSVAGTFCSSIYSIRIFCIC